MKLSCLNVFGGESFLIASGFRIKDVVPSLFIVYPSHSNCLQANYYLSNDMARFSPTNPQESFVDFVCLYRFDLLVNTINMSSKNAQVFEQFVSVSSMAF